MTDDDTLRLIADAARGFAAFDAGRVRSWRDRPPCFDRDLWRDMAGQGWFAIFVAERDGGLGLDGSLERDAAAAVAEALGRACAPEPFVAGGIIAPLVLARCAAGSVRDAALAEVIGGETIATLAWQGPTGELDPAGAPVRATSGGPVSVLDGEARFVPVAHADAFIVHARDANGDALVWVPAATPGLAITAEPQADGGACARLTFNAVEVLSSARLAGPEGAIAILDEAIDTGVIANCAEINGGVARALELTLDYLKTRQQFGRPIGAFQVLQHRAVDLWMAVEVARHATSGALARMAAPDATPASRAVAASSAKARVGEVARHIANETVQLHGAIGFTDEYDLGLYVNRLLATVPYLGNADEHRRRYARLRQDRRRPE